MPALTRLFPLAVAATVVACGPQKATTTPEPVAAVPHEEEVAEPEPPPNPRRVGDDAVAVGTFNLHWAHDSLDERVPKLARKFRARSEEDWAWKVKGIAQLLVDEKLDIVALQEVGGESEITDITAAVSAAGGPDYSIAWVDSHDPHTGHQVAILSRYPIVQETRFDIHLRKHVAADIELPGGDVVTFVAIHARGGKYVGHEKSRAKQARALKRQIETLRKQRPVIVLGTANSSNLPGDSSYARSSVGVLAGANTRKAADDCADSASFMTGQRTTVDGGVADRIISCGLELRDVETTGDQTIIRDEPDPVDVAWSQIPIEDAPYRDLSDHLVLWAEVALPVKPPSPDADDADDSDGAA